MAQSGSAAQLGLWYVEHCFAQADKNRDGSLSMEELSYYREEFVYYLSPERFEREDRDADGLLNVREFRQSVMAAWAYRIRRDRHLLGRLYQQYAYLRDARVQYLKRFPNVTRQLLGNFLWLSEHYEIVDKLLSDSHWLRTHPLALAALHTNFRWLAEHPLLADKLYQLRFINDLFPEWNYWRTQHFYWMEDHPSMMGPYLTAQLPSYQMPASMKIGAGIDNFETAQRVWARSIDSLCVVNQAMENMLMTQVNRGDSLELVNGNLGVELQRIMRLYERDSLYHTAYSDSMRQLTLLQGKKIISLESDLQNANISYEAFEKRVIRLVDSLHLVARRYRSEREEALIRSKDLQRENIALRNSARQSRASNNVSSARPASGSVLRQGNNVNQADWERLRLRYALSTDSLRVIKSQYDSLQRYVRRVYNPEQENIKLRNEELEKQILRLNKRAIQAEEEKNKAQKAYQEAMTFAVSSDSTRRKIALLELENQSMREQLEDNTAFIGFILGEKEKLDSRLIELEAETQRLQLALEKASQLDEGWIAAWQDSVKRLQGNTQDLRIRLKQQREQIRIAEDQCKQRENILKEEINQLGRQVATLEETRKMSQDRFDELLQRERELKKEQAELLKKEQILKQQQKNMGDLLVRQENLRKKAQELQLWEKRLEQREKALKK